jgi:hypothetical protein
MMMPFNAVIPEGAKAYVIGDDLVPVQMRSIPAHTPVVVEAQGETIFTGQGGVGYAVSPLSDMFRGTYTPIPLYEGDYVLGQQDGQWGLCRVDTPTVLGPFDVYARLSSTESFVPLSLSASGIVTLATGGAGTGSVYDLQGRKMRGTQLRPGLYLKNGRKVVIK